MDFLRSLGVELGSAVVVVAGVVLDGSVSSTPVIFLIIWGALSEDSERYFLC